MGEHVVIDNVAFGSFGNVLRATRNGLGDFGGIVTKPTVDNGLLIKSGGYAEFKSQLYIPGQVRGKWYVEARDIEGKTIRRKRIRPSADKWEDISLVFKTEPAGGWWSGAYGYRRQIVVTAPDDMGLGADTSVFVRIDTSSLVSAGKLRADRKDWRVVFFNGVESIEIPREYTGPVDAAGEALNGSDETWFRLQQELPAGRSADGSFDDTTSDFYGTYYVYFGNPVETLDAMSASEDVFHKKAMVGVGEGTIDTDGVFVHRTTSTAYRSLSVEDVTLDDGAGSISMKYKPAVNFTGTALQSDGLHAIRTLLDNVMADGTRLRLYVFQTLLCLQITEAPAMINGKVSTFHNFASADVSDWRTGNKYSVIAQWSERNPDRLRDMHIYIDGVDRTITPKRV